MYTMSVPAFYRGQKKAMDTPAMLLNKVLSHHVGAVTEPRSSARVVKCL